MPYRRESNGKKAPILWEKYEYQFPRLSPYHWFCCIFPCCGNLWGNPCISHMMTLVNFFLILTIVIALFRVQYNKYYPSSSYFSNKTKYEKKRKYWPSLARCSKTSLLLTCVCVAGWLAVCLSVCLFTSIHREGFLCVDRLEC